MCNFRPLSRFTSLIPPRRKLADWDSEDEFGPSPDYPSAAKSTGSSNKNARVVVLKHMFTLQELEEDASLLLDLKEDVRDECSALGEVTNVVLYDVSQIFKRDFVLD